MSNVARLRLDTPALRNVLRGAERDAAVRAAANWYCQNRDLPDTLNAIAARLNISMTASAEAILLATGKRGE